MMDTRAAAQILWDFHCVYDDLHRADVIVGLGSYDLRVATRCAELFHAGLSDRIIFSGASGNWTSQLYQTSEAEVFKDHAVKEGVPEDAIILERHATHIGENMRFSTKLVPAAQRVIIVTKPQTQLRCKATALRQWPGIAALITAPETLFEAQPLPHHDERALICEMVGDVARMTTYAERGFQMPVDIPAAVQQAFDKLVYAGFVDHLPA